MIVNRIHYLIHPLWQLYVDREGTSRLVDKLIDIVEQEGQDENTIFILEMNGFGHYFVENEDDYEELHKKEIGLEFNEAINQIVAHYFMLASKLTKSLETKCKNLFTGHPAYRTSIPHFAPSLESRFEKYIQKNQIVFGDNCEIISHGAIIDACVPARSETLVRAIKKSYKQDINYRINADTAL